jgi:predicted DNA binding protein
VFRTGRPVRTFRHGIRRPDGTERWLSSNSAPIVADDGTIEGAVVGLEDVTGLKEREESLQTQRSELLRLNRINSVIRGVAHEMTRAGSPEDIENALCGLIATSEPYLFAVLGQFSSSYTEFIPRASAGVGDEYLESMLDNPDAPPLDQGPGATAAKTGEIQVVQNITDLPYQYWQDAAENYRFHSYASVPLTHGKDLYGVLGVYAKLPAAFDREERSLLTELGQMVGYALDTLETRKKLRREQVVELTFRSEALARSITEEDGDALRVTGDGIVEVTDDAHLQFYTVKGMPAKEVIDLLDRLHTGEVRLLSTSDDRVEVQVRMPPESLASRLVAVEGEIASISIEDGVSTLVVQLPDSGDRRSVTSCVREVYPDLDLVSEDLVFSLRTFRHAVEARLTDRQMATVELAYQTGYFEQPRRSTGEDVAEQMGVTPTTAHRHLRNAEERIFRELFDTSWRG